MMIFMLIVVSLFLIGGGVFCYIKDLPRVNSYLSAENRSVLRMANQCVFIYMPCAMVMFLWALVLLRK